MLTMSSGKMLNVRLPEDLNQTLESLVGATGRTKSFLATEALRRYLEVEAWQLKDIQEGIQEADSGEFAPTEEVDSFFAKHGC